MASSRRSIMVRDMSDGKKHFSLTSKDPKPKKAIKPVRTLMSLQKSIKPVNTNKSCVEDSSHIKTINNLAYIRNMLTNLYNIQLSNNAAISESPLILKNDVVEDFSIFIQNFKEMRIQNRFIFKKNLGEGSFGQVIECLDINRDRILVAIKIAKKKVSNEQIRSREVDTLLLIQKKDPSQFNHCVTLIHWFKIQNRMCLVFKRYGDDLFTFMKKRKFKALPLTLVSEIAFQLFDACMFLHDTCHIIHADLKPHNILFTSHIYISKEERRLKQNILPSKSDIKIIDFGSSVRMKSEKKYTVIGTRHYRALEVILGLPWNEKIDCWSVGCILYELCTGKHLFQTKEDNEHLAMIEHFIGPINTSMTKSCKMTNVFLKSGLFNKSLLIDYDFIEKQLTLQQRFKPNLIHTQMLYHIIFDCLKNDPSERPNFRDLLKSPVFIYLPESFKRKYRRNGINHNLN